MRWLRAGLCMGVACASVVLWAAAPAFAVDAVVEGDAKQPWPGPGTLQADETGMVPGDLLLGNMNTFPGHAGIYLGKWERLPTELQERYAGVHETMLIRSRDVGFQDSYLAVDSDGGRGVRLVPFAEQFTDFLPKGSGPNLPGALHWESGRGMAAAWPDLPATDARRWKIVEEALKATEAWVPYPTSHTQWETTFLQSGTPYSEMDSMDCTGLVHVVYYRGAGIDLDVSWAPWHTPGQLLEAAESRNMGREVRLEPVWRDAMMLGVWDVALTMRSGEKQETINEQILVRVWGGDLHPFTQAMDYETGELRGKRNPLEMEFRRTEDAQLAWEYPGSEGRMKMGIDRDRQVLLHVDTMTDDGPMYIHAEGGKRYDYQNARRQDTAAAGGE